MRGDSRGKEYLGQGLAFPLHINARGELALATPERDIEQAIRIILGTRPGERVMRPDFGCRAHELLFEPLNVGTETLMQQYVVEALAMWEPRIDVLGVNVYVDKEMDGGLWTEIYYVIKATHDERSIVYPFFLAGEEEW
jgi:phage baseplate assembly protein W